MFVAAIRDPSEDEKLSEGRAVQAAVPLRLQLTGSASGNPDLRLQLVSVRVGTACEQLQLRQPSKQHNAFTAGMKP